MHHRVREPQVLIFVVWMALVQAIAIAARHPVRYFVCVERGKEVALQREHTCHAANHGTEASERTGRHWRGSPYDGAARYDAQHAAASKVGDHPVADANLHLAANGPHLKGS
jgi:hypothetical protein